MTRLTSGNYLDDHSLYHNHESNESLEIEESNDESELGDGEKTVLADAGEGSGESEEALEVRDGIENGRDKDLEAGPELHKSKSSKSRRSVRDPNLVTWDGPDDRDNPKNWSLSRKWTATFVGMYANFSAPKF